MILHPWHEVSPGENAPQIVNAIVEIPEGSRIKYEIDKPSGLIKMDRMLFSSMQYPCNYGFIPQTYGGDGDPLDILVITHSPLVPLCLVEAIPIGVMRMRDKDEVDDKIIAVAAKDITVCHYKGIADLPEHFIAELRNFFEVYKQLENRKIIVQDFLDKAAAVEIIRHDLQYYQDCFVNNKK